LDYSTSFKDKIILVTGGTGTIGSEIVSQLLDMNPKTIRIYKPLTKVGIPLWRTRAKFRSQDVVCKSKVNKRQSQR